MVVEDVFSIAKRGKAITRKIEASTLKAGDVIVMRGKGMENRALVDGMEAFRKMVDQANAGDTVGILLKDMAKQDVQRADEIRSARSDFSRNPSDPPKANTATVRDPAKHPGSMGTTDRLWRGNRQLQVSGAGPVRKIAVLGLERTGDAQKGDFRQD